MVYFDKIVGDIHELLKGTSSKTFLLDSLHEELINTNSGNLVQFARDKDECKEKFSIRNLGAKIVGDGVVEIDEIVRGLLFDENRTVRLRLRDADRADELICYLHEKTQAIIEMEA